MGDRVAAVADDARAAALEAALNEGLRRRHGQHFTKSDPADLMIALCVREGGAHVLDPACGTGVLLRRAAAPRRFLAGVRALRGGLVGVERDPRLAAETVRTVPGVRVVEADFLEAGVVAPASIDAVVGNPPYVRQELIDPALKGRGSHEGPALSGRSDLHMRFWPPALASLRPGGRLGFIASATWLDAEYGAALREWLSREHRLVAIVESQAESWFDRARVRTAIVIVQRDAPDPTRPVRFVSLRAPLGTLVPPELPENERLAGFDRLARAIEGTTSDIGLGATVGVRDGEPIAVRNVALSSLHGRTWGPLLRLPDLYFEIMDRARARMAPLSEVATVRWGIKTGDDAVFCPMRVDEPPVEPRFLSPMVFRLSELDRLVVTEDQLRRWVLLVDRRSLDLQHTGSPRLDRWLARAERERRSHLRPTCASRAGKDRAWYELRPATPGAILWSIMHQYRHLAPLNSPGFPVNDNLLQVDPRKDVPVRLLAAILNSHVVALIKHAHGRQRNEGMLKTQAGDLKSMPIPDPRAIGKREAAGILEAFDAIAARRIGPVPSECEQDDRRALDRAVLEALGWSRGDAGSTVTRLYYCLKGLYAGERRWEVDALRRRRSLGVDARARCAGVHARIV